ncbi:unnamed protein product, partial [Owenia fusiformis]
RTTVYRMASKISSLDGAKERVKVIREQNYRCSEEVVELWETVLENNIPWLGDELWLIYEQVCIAAFDCGRLEIGQDCITALHNKFPNSLRVMKLLGMELEAIGEYEKAKQEYNEILQRDPTNQFAKKRLIAVHKCENNYEKAIEQLTKYLNECCGDYEAWGELCDLYLGQNDFQKAAFCMEELILQNPHNHLYYQRYAEIKYSQGEYATALSYFSQAAKLNPENMRALFGVLLSSSHYAHNDSKSKSKNSKYGMWASKQIEQRYEKKLRNTTDKGKEQLKAIEMMCDSKVNISSPQMNH